MNKGQKIGIIIFIIIAVIGGIIVFTLTNDGNGGFGSGRGVKLRGYIGGEKKAFWKTKK